MNLINTLQKFVDAYVGEGQYRVLLGTGHDPSVGADTIDILLSVDGILVYSREFFVGVDIPTIITVLRETLQDERI